MNTSTKLYPMLAKPFNPRYLKPPVFAQAKLDGVRLLWDGVRAWSRTGKPIEGVPGIVAELEKHFAGFALDGEIYNHEMHFQEIVGSARRKNGAEDLRLQFHIYDHPVAGVPFTERWRRLEAAVRKAKGVTRIVVVKTIAADMDNLNPFAGEGYEGTMLRNGAAEYRFAHRSSDLLKVKTSQDDDFKVVGITEQLSYDKPLCPEGTPGARRHTNGTFYTNINPKPMGTAGALTCVTKTGEEFDVGTGMDDATRLELWQNPPIGKICTVKFQELSLGGIPRFPVFKSVRDYE